MISTGPLKGGVLTNDIDKVIQFLGKVVKKRYFSPYYLRGGAISSVHTSHTLHWIEQSDKQIEIPMLKGI